MITGGGGLSDNPTPLLIERDFLLYKLELLVSYAIIQKSPYMVS